MVLWFYDAHVHDCASQLCIEIHIAYVLQILHHKYNACFTSSLVHDNELDSCFIMALGNASRDECIDTALHCNAGVYSQSRLSLSYSFLGFGSTTLSEWSYNCIPGVHISTTSRISTSETRYLHHDTSYTIDTGCHQCRLGELNVRSDLDKNRILRLVKQDNLVSTATMISR
jgi:hypothetical protein